MKKIFLLTAVLIGSFEILNGQITLTSKTHSFRIGDSHNFVFLNNADEGLAGANVIWDFSNLSPVNKTLISHMLDPNSIPLTNPSNNANFVLEEFGNYFFFRNSSNLMEQYATVFGKSTVKYDKSIPKLKFPMSYGFKMAGNYSGVQICPSDTLPVTGNYEVFADAYGTIILPNNITIDNVLRVKQTRTINIQGNDKITEVTYRWYAADIRYPLFVIIKYITPQQTYTAETAMYAEASNHKKSAMGISMANNNATFEIYPNPFEDKLMIDINLNESSNITLELFDISGKTVKTLIKSKNYTAGSHTLNFFASKLNLKEGTYYLKISTSKETILRKIVKQ
jgi:hypothetical protein